MLRCAISSLIVLILAPGSAGAVTPADGIHKIQHVIIIMQENRSFDSYFGTFPGADGIPMRDGVAQVCVPNEETKTCVRPYHDTNDEDTGGPHGAKAADLDIDGGKMDGFVDVMNGAQRTGGCPTDIPTCVVKGHAHLARASELLGLCAQLRSARSLVRAGAIVESANAPLHGFGVGRRLRHDRRSGKLQAGAHVL